MTVRMGRAASGVMGIVLLAGPSAWATASAEHNPLAPAADQVAARFARVQQEINRLQAAGQTTAAAQMQARLQHFQDELNGTAPSGLSGPTLEWVSIYQGLQGSGSGSNPPPTGTVAVHVQATDRPIVLALGAYTPIQWNLQLDPGVTLAKVILSGIYTQSVTNLPAGVPVQTGTQFLGYGKSYDYSYPQGAQWLYSQTGLGPSSVQGQYQYSGTPFLVGPGNSDWRAQHVLREMQGLYQDATAYDQGLRQAAAASFHFKGIYRTYTTNPYGPFVTSSAISEMTPLGAVPGSQKPVAASPYEVAIDPSSSTYYGVDGRGAYRINPTTGQTTDLPTGAGAPELSWPTGITFDTLRNRVVMSSLGGEGFLYAYSPQSNQWTLVSSLQQTDIQALTYFPANDTLYALPVSYAPVTEILRYDSQGHPLAPLSLTELIAPTGGGGEIGNVQLMVAGNRLALLTAPVVDLNFPERQAVQRAYLIDPTTGEVTYSGVFPLPEPGAALGVLALVPWLAARKRRAGLAR